MTRPYYSPLTHARATEALLETTDHPLHRAILLNYRRHALLEVAGRWEEILVPELTIDHPVYRISKAGKLDLYDGRDAVAAFYGGMRDAGMNVFGPVSQKLMVGDWGFASETVFQMNLPGSKMDTTDPQIDPRKCYSIEWVAASIWHYTADGLLIGEHVYEQAESRTVSECVPSAIITPAEAAAMLAPLLDG